MKNINKLPKFKFGLHHKKVMIIGGGDGGSGVS